MSHNNHCRGRMNSPSNIKRQRYTCPRKKRHPNESQALNHAKKVQRKSGYPMSVYQCCHCGYWHVGNAIRPAIKKSIENNIKAELGGE